MKAFDFEAVTYDGAVYCIEHCPVPVTNDSEVYPIFADSEWDHYPVCSQCHEKHTYVNLTDEGRIEEFNASEKIKDLMHSNGGVLPKYTWPGGYPIAYFDAENNTLCQACAMKNNEFSSKLDSCSINWDNPDLHCDHCGERIESAYAEED